MSTLMDAILMKPMELFILPQGNIPISCPQAILGCQCTTMVMVELLIFAVLLDLYIFGSEFFLVLWLPLIFTYIFILNLTYLYN